MNLLVHTSESNVAAQINRSESGDLLVLEAPEQEFPQQGLSTYRVVKAVSTEKILALATSDLRECIAFEFSLVKDVAFVYTAFRNNEVFYVWIVIDEFERAVREGIYERQRVIIDEFPMFQFDFYIIGLLGRDVTELIGDPSMHLTYKRE